MMWFRYMLLILIVPTYFIALLRRWWTTIPLWLVSTFAMLTQFALSVQSGAAPSDGAGQSALIYVGEMTKIMVIPIAVEIALVLSRLGIGARMQREELEGTWLKR